MGQGNTIATSSRKAARHKANTDAQPITRAGRPAKTTTTSNATAKRTPRRISPSALRMTASQVEQDPSDSDEAIRLQEEQAATDAMASAAQVDAQLAALKVFLRDNVGSEADEAPAGPSSCFDVDALQKNLASAGGGGGASDGDDNDDVSLHSADYEDESLLQGLRELDDDLQAEFRAEVQRLSEAITEHKQAALVCMRERNDKASAVRELQLAKKLEKQLEELQSEHVVPLAIRMEQLHADMEALQETVQRTREQSLAALRAGEKPTALAILKDAKCYEMQLKELRETYAKMQHEYSSQLRCTGGDEAAHSAGAV